jgi:hypothetical protein
MSARIRAILSAPSGSFRRKGGGYGTVNG